MSDQQAEAVPNESAQQKQEAKRKKEYQANRAALSELCTLYPDVFDLAAPKPLKIGVHEAIAADGKLSKTRIRRALNLYVRMRRYVASLVEGAERITLGGAADGIVTADEAKHAIEKLAEIDKKRSQRKPSTAKKPAKAAKDKRPAKTTTKHPKPEKKPAAKTKAEEPGDAQERLQAKLAALVSKHNN